MNDNANTTANTASVDHKERFMVPPDYMVDTIVTFEFNKTFENIRNFEYSVK